MIVEPTDADTGTRPRPRIAPWSKRTARATRTPSGPSCPTTTACSSRRPSAAWATAATPRRVAGDFEAAFQAVCRFGRPGEFRLGAWLSRILSNVCNDHGGRAAAERASPVMSSSARSTRAMPSSVSRTPSCSAPCTTPSTRCRRNAARHLPAQGARRALLSTGGRPARDHRGQRPGTGAPGQGRAPAEPRSRPRRWAASSPSRSGSAPRCVAAGTSRPPSRGRRRRGGSRAVVGRAGRRQPGRTGRRCHRAERCRAGARRSPPSPASRSPAPLPSPRSPAAPPSRRPTGRPCRRRSHPYRTRGAGRSAHEPRGAPGAGRGACAGARHQPLVGTVHHEPAAGRRRVVGHRRRDLLPGADPVAIGSPSALSSEEVGVQHAGSARVVSKVDLPDTTLTPTETDAASSFALSAQFLDDALGGEPLHIVARIYLAGHDGNSLSLDLTRGGDSAHLAALLVARRRASRQRPTCSGAGRVAHRGPRGLQPEFLAKLEVRTDTTRARTGAAVDRLLRVRRRAPRRREAHHRVAGASGEREPRSGRWRDDPDRAHVAARHVDDHVAAGRGRRRLSVRRVLLVAHSLPPDEHSGTPFTTLGYTRRPSPGPRMRGDGAPCGVVAGQPGVAPGTSAPARRSHEWRCPASPMPPRRWTGP